jgi:hypothetical protein
MRQQSPFSRPRRAIIDDDRVLLSRRAAVDHLGEHGDRLLARLFLHALGLHGCLAATGALGG